MYNLISYRESKLNFDYVMPVITIPLTDLILCKIFGTKARWFQLHSVINIIITIIVWNDVYLLVINPTKNLNTMTSIMDFYYIVFLHIYHSLFFKNTKMDYFHHILFVGLGTIPVYYLYDKNVIRLTTFVGCGLPGSIEYLTLSLVKNNRMKQIHQKRIMAYIYNYFRYPFSIFSTSMIYMLHNLGYTNIKNISISYIIILIFFNGGFYNRVTIENYALHKYIHYGRINSYHTL